MLKDPVAVERGRRDGEKAQENRRKLVEFKNMFSGLFEALFGPDEIKDYGFHNPTRL